MVSGDVVVGGVLNACASGDEPAVSSAGISTPGADGSDSVMITSSGGACECAGGVMVVTGGINVAAAGAGDACGGDMLGVDGVVAVPPRLSSAPAPALSSDIFRLFVRGCGREGSRNNDEVFELNDIGGCKYSYGNYAGSCFQWATPAKGEGYLLLRWFGWLGLVLAWLGRLSEGSLQERHCVCTAAATANWTRY